MNTAHSLLLSARASQIKDCINKLSSDHKDLHGSVSKVGKAIDRVCIQYDFNLQIACLNL